jgi:hypothetical protein
MKGKFVEEKAEHKKLIKNLLKHFKKDEQDLQEDGPEGSIEEEVIALDGKLPKHLREVFMKSKKYKDEDEDSGEYDAEDSLMKDSSMDEEDEDESYYSDESEEEEMPDRADKETRKRMVIALMKKGK